MSLKLSDVTIGTSCCSSANLDPEAGQDDAPLRLSFGTVLKPQARPPRRDDRPGAQNAPFFHALAGDRVSLSSSGRPIGTACCSSAKVSVLKPDGTTLLSASSFGTSGGFVDTKTLPQTGAYRIVVDPQSNAVGSVTLTLYDVPDDPAADARPRRSRIVACTRRPGPQRLEDVLRDGRPHSHPPAHGRDDRYLVLQLGQVAVLRPDGTTLVSPAYFGTSGKTLSFSLPATGVYSVFVDPQSNGVGSATLSVS